MLTHVEQVYFIRNQSKKRITSLLLLIVLYENTIIFNSHPTIVVVPSTLVYTCVNCIMIHDRRFVRSLTRIPSEPSVLQDHGLIPTLSSDKLLFLLTRIENNNTNVSEVASLAEIVCNPTDWRDKFSEVCGIISTC